MDVEEKESRSEKRVRDTGEGVERVLSLHYNIVGGWPKG